MVGNYFSGTEKTEDMNEINHILNFELKYNHKTLQKSYKKLSPAHKKLSIDSRVSLISEENCCTQKFSSIFRIRNRIKHTRGVCVCVMGVRVGGWGVGGFVSTYNWPNPYHYIFGQVLKANRTKTRKRNQAIRKLNFIKYYAAMKHQIVVHLSCRQYIYIYIN